MQKNEKNNLLDFLGQEKPVNQYKQFFKMHLINLSNRQEILTKLVHLCNEVRKTEPKFVFSPDPERHKLEVKIDSFLKENFDDEIIKLFNKEIPTLKPNRKDNEFEDSFLLGLLAAMSDSFEQLNEKYKKEWNYKTNFLNFLYDCLYHYGLHPNILIRDAEINKSFNLIIYHNYRSDTKLLDFKILMTYEEFDKSFISQYVKQKPIKMGGKLIPFENIHEVKITTSLLKEDEIELFALKNRFCWTENKKDYLSFINCSKDETETYHPNPFDETTHNTELNKFLIEEIKHYLISYPKSFKLYMSALSKFNQGNLERNVLDDLRLSLELLLREILNNKKSLENQLSEVGNYQNKRGATREATNMFHKLIEYYTKYHNSYIKHDDLVQKNEVEFVFDLTGTFIKYLIKE